jgi:hypothetical protein
MFNLLLPVTVPESSPLIAIQPERLQETYQEN